MIQRRPAARRQGRRARGNALVEFVLVMPFFLLLVLGAIDWGWYFVVREVAINATRQGARVGSAGPAETRRSDAESAADAYLHEALPMFSSVSSHADPETCNVPGAAVPCIKVSLTVDGLGKGGKKSLTGFPLTGSPEKLTAVSKMRIEQP